MDFINQQRHFCFVAAGSWVAITLRSRGLSARASSTPCSGSLDVFLGLSYLGTPGNLQKPQRNPNKSHRMGPQFYSLWMFMVDITN